MSKAKNGDKVVVHYTGRLEDGSVFDSTDGEDPFTFRLGEGEVIPGFEKIVVGMKAGQERTETIEPEDAYGLHDDDLRFTIGREQFPDDLALEVGERLELEREDGASFEVTVHHLTDSDVTLDANHLLAGKALTFDITLVEVAEVAEE